MAESMKGLHRSHRCTEVSSANIGEKVTVMGWVQKRRNLGSLIFIDLRDRSGLLQIVFDEESVGAEGFAKAGTLRSEYVDINKGKLHICLCKLRLTVCTQILVTEAAGDLEIPVIAGCHQKLLEQLRRLRQCIEISRMYTAWHKIIPGTFRCGLAQDRSLDL